MDKLIEKLDMAKFLTSIHEYLVTIDHDKKSQNDDLGVRIVKTLVNEIVKLKRGKVWDSYDVIELHPQKDLHIKKWMQIILKSLPVDDHYNRSFNKSLEPEQPRGKVVTEFEFKKIVKELRDMNLQESGIKNLDKFIKSNPSYDYKAGLKKESDFFA